MTERTSRLELSMAAEPVSVRLLRAEILRWVGDVRPGDEELGACVALATSEALGNVVRHAYRESAGRVDVEAGCEREEIVVRVIDRGGGVRTDRDPGTGIGMGLIGRLASGAKVVSDAEGTVVTMRFSLPAPARRGPRPRVGRGDRAIAAG